MPALKFETSNIGLLNFVSTKVKWFFLSLFCLTLIGCSSSSFVYRNLNWIVPWYMDDFVQFNERQDIQFEQLLDKVLAWHKDEELTRYQNKIAEIQQALKNPIDETFIQNAEEFAMKSVDRIRIRFVPDLVAIFSTIDDKQQKQLWEKLDEQQKELEEKYLERDEEDYIESTEERRIESMERWLGDLTPEQKNRMSEQQLGLQRYDQYWLDSRKKWLNNLKQNFVQEGADWPTRMEKLLTEEHRFKSEEHKEIEASNRKKIHKMIIEVINSRTPEQDKYLNEQLDLWSSRFKRWQKEKN